MKTLLILSSAFLASLIVILIASSKYRVNFDIDIRKLIEFKARKRWLEQADIQLDPFQFWIALTSLGFVSFLITYFVTKIFLISLVAAISISFIPYSLISKRRLQKSKQLMYAWPDVLRDINATIASGHTLTFALKIIAAQGTEPIASHMKRFVGLEKNFGFRTAIEIIREDMNDATSDRVIEVLILANERGGKVVKQIIDDLIDSTVEEITLTETIENESLEMKINSRAVVILPWCVLLLLILSGGVFRDYYQSKSGSLVIGLGIILSVAGLYILNKLSQIQIEPRVFRAKEL